MLTRRMRMRHLVMFDVDGTLTSSVTADSACFARGLSRYLAHELTRTGRPTKTCGNECDGLPFASADDACERATIMGLAYDRATAQLRLPRFEEVTYIGEQPWDLAAARTLGYRFLGIASGAAARELYAAGAVRVIPEFGHITPSHFPSFAD